MVQEHLGLDIAVAFNLPPIMSSHRNFCNTEVKFFILLVYLLLLLDFITLYPKFTFIHL